MIRNCSIIAVPPGATICELMDEKRMSQKELATILDTSEKQLCALINGEIPITPDIANSLEAALEVPAKFWINLESIYRKKLFNMRGERKHAHNSK